MTQVALQQDVEQLQTKDILKPLAVIFSIIFIEFLIMGISLAIIPIFVHETLGFGNVIVGAVVGLQYAATLCSRSAGGKLADIKGGRRSVITGIIISSLSGCFCLLSYFLYSSPTIALLLLSFGRVLLGIGESYLVIGIFAWGFAIVGPKHTGKVMVWNGMGMYAGMACGAPLGLYISSAFSNGVAFACIVVFPLIGLLTVRLLQVIATPKHSQQLPFTQAIATVWKAGTGLALASIGFGAIASFVTLYFNERSWSHATLAISAFGFGYIIVRVFLAHLPDKIGGAKVAVFSLPVEIFGQMLIWQATGPLMAICGALLTGIGMSLIFPSFGVLAIKHVAPNNRGMAMAAYNSFFDLAIGLTAPVAGLIANYSSYSDIYIFGATAAFVSLLLALAEIKKR
jgi:MFS family permease